jgi:hypothetical protein
MTRKGKPTRECTHTQTYTVQVLSTSEKPLGVIAADGISFLVCKDKE